MSALSFLDWFTGGTENPYMSLFHCMAHDTLWVTITVALDLAVAAGYGVIAVHWWKNQRHLPPIPAKRALNTLRNIFVFCGICGYAFIPIKMFWPAWRLYDIFMAALVYFTWKYAWSARDLKVVYTELGRSATLAAELEVSKLESRQKSTFLNALSHDLRTPLNGLMLQANLAELSLAGNDTESLKSAVTEIKSSAKATADLLDSLLECARADWSEQQHAVADFSLTEVIETLVNSSQAAANERGIYFKHSCSAGLNVRTDRLKLERILANLTSNALKFTHKGGIRIDVQQSGRGIEIHVADTGVGIPLEHRERIFEEFFQVHNEHRDRSKGFGLGLSIARRLARQLGGDISVDSSPGAGSRFSVVLPNVLGSAHEIREPGTELDEQHRQPAGAGTGPVAVGAGK